MDINLVFIVFGEYEKLPIIQSCIAHSIDRIKPKSTTILNQKDLDEICKQSFHYEKHKDHGCFASDVARLLYLQRNPHTLYLDADSEITQETLDFIESHIDDSIIAGWQTLDSKKVSTCSGSFCYRGAQPSILFDEMIKKYEETAHQGKLLTDTTIVDEFFTPESTDVEGAVAKYFDTLVFDNKGLHLNTSNIIYMKNQLKNAYPITLIKEYKLYEKKVVNPGFYILVVDPMHVGEVTQNIMWGVQVVLWTALIPFHLQESFIETLKIFFPHLREID